MKSNIKIPANIISDDAHCWCLTNNDQFVPMNAISDT